MPLHKSARHLSRSRLRRILGPVERLEPRMMLSASSIGDKPYIDVGPSDNVAWDQPRVTVQLLTEDFPDGTLPPSNIIVGPNTFNSWLLDTGANTTLAFQTAVTDMTDVPPQYETDGLFNELGVGGVDLFDVSIPYRFDFAGDVTFQRNKLLDSRIISKSDRDLSIFGPWGIVGMPAMTERVTTMDFTPWTNVQGFDLFMQTDFTAELPAPLGPRYSIAVDNRVSFSPEGSVVSGPGIPMWADLPFFGAQLKNNESLSEGDFLFDTGAQVSIISSRMAFELGLDSNKDGVLNALDSNFARTETIGGIAGQTQVPVFLIDEVHIPTVQGPDMVWTDLQWIILDIVEGIDGVFGFDNLTSGWIEAFGVDGQSGYLLQSHFDFRGWDKTGQALLHFDFNPEYFTLVDPLGPGAVITETGDSTTVTENDVGSDTYEVRLSQAPTANVTVTFEGGNGQVGAVDAANPSNDFLTFTPSNWNVPQTALVKAVNDSVLEGYHRAFVRHTSSSADPNYDNVGMPRISVGIVDDDFAGMMILPSDGETRVTEGGESDYYDIVLMTQPTTDVFILIQHVANQVQVGSEATGGTLLTFTAENWNVPQRVLVTAIDDDLEEDDLLPAYITHTIGSYDENYAQAFGLVEKGFVRDNDGADQIGPRITDVIVGSSGWSDDFIDIVDGGGSGSGTGLGVSLTGDSQLDNLPWINIDKIYLQFDDNVSADFHTSNVQLTGINQSTYLSGAALAYGVDGENVGTLTLATPIANDVLSLNLLDSLRDSGGNALDGEWVNGSSLVSGDGTNGGNFSFRIESLPGDVDDSGGVTLVDVFDVFDENGTITSSTELSRLDVDGSGGINLVDLFGVYNRNGNILPNPPTGGGGGNLLPPGDAATPRGDTGNGDSGFGGAILLDGYGGVQQAFIGGGRSGSELDRINPFLRGALRRAEKLAATAIDHAHDFVLGNSLSAAPTEASIPPVEHFSARTQSLAERAADDALEELEYADSGEDLEVDVVRQRGLNESSVDRRQAGRTATGLNHRQSVDLQINSDSLADYESTVDSLEGPFGQAED